MANVHHENGNTAYRKGEFNEALDHYTRAIQTDPRSAILFSNRAACRYFLQQYSEALADADYAVKLRANYSKAHYWRGAVLVKQDKLPEARGALTQAVRLDKIGTNAKAKTLLAQVKELLKDDDAEPLPKVGGKRRLDGEEDNMEDSDEDEEQPSKKKKRGRQEPPEGEVDVESGHAHHGVVLKEHGGPWNVRLSKREQYCKIQIIHVPSEVPGDEKYFLFYTCIWPFQPDKQQTSITELTAEEAMHSFKRMFRERTGFAWEDRKKRALRQPQHGKFRVERG